METQLSWRKDWFGSSCEILSGDTSVGRLQEKVWSQSAEGSFHGKNYRFETKGFLTPETLITDIDKDTVVGGITYNAWKNRATIEYLGEQYDWRYDGLWHNKWEISRQGEPYVRYHESVSRREITVHQPDELLTLAGLYVGNYWQASTAWVAAAFIPIFS